MHDATDAKRAALVHQASATSVKPVEPATHSISGGPAWSAEDWRVFFQERASIAEYDAKMPRDQAERHALLMCRIEWANQNPPPDPGEHRCAECGLPTTPADLALRFGRSPRWLHVSCLAPWRTKREKEARSALAAIGLPIVDLRAGASEA